jgi:hypothetical protein
MKHDYIKATKTLKAIENALRVDDGALFRKFQKELLPTIGDAYSQEPEGFRSHLGCSVIGKECSREIWYGFRWATREKFEGRMIRLFNRGHLEEGRFLAIIKMIGCEVWQQTEDGKQFRIKHAGGHVGGSLDAVIMGILDIPKGEACLGEFKTHSQKSFDQLPVGGFKKSKPEHYVQMQLYMRKMKLNYGLYLAVNKNTDEIWGEIIELDPAFADLHFTNAKSLVFSDSPPLKLYNSPGWYKCRFCTFKDICHNGAQPEINCRTCKQSLAQPDGTWVCRNTGELLDKDAQLAACGSYDQLRM